MFFEPRPFKSRRPQYRLSERRLLLRLGDVLAIFVAILLSLLIWTIVDQRRPYTLWFVIEQAYWFILLPALWLLLAAANDLYDLQLAADRTASITRLVAVTLQLVVVYFFIFFLSPRTALPRLFILYYGVTSFVLLTLWRIWRPFLMGWVSEPRRALIVGDGLGAEVIIRAISEYAPGQYELIGLVSSEGSEPADDRIMPVLGAGADMLDLALSNMVVELIVATPCELSEDLFQGVMACYQQGISIVPIALLYERLTGRVPVELVGKDWAIVLPIETASLFDPYPLIKRVSDVVLSLVGLIFFGALLIVLIPLIKLDSPGPVFFRQVRLGKGGRLFRVLKLRSMIPDAEAQTGAVFTRLNDDRITRVGRFLRKSRLDEVPQLWNVLLGEMSLIGPRPERPEFIEELTAEIPYYRARLAVKPGVTGWAQVRYPYVNSLDGHLIKLQYDLYYVRHQSLVLDLQIVVRTVGRMLSLAGQ
ncbi:MAG: sugar transferase [Anaerolineae bacterium]|nr:sugar transferase [Anaerolineae bacterium]